MYTDALTYAYNCQLQTYTAAPLFESALTRPPSPTATQADKYSLGTTISQVVNAQKRLLGIQARYKKTYDNRLRRDKTFITSEAYVVLLV